MKNNIETNPMRLLWCTESTTGILLLWFAVFCLVPVTVYRNRSSRVPYKEPRAAIKCRVADGDSLGFELKFLCF